MSTVPHEINEFEDSPELEAEMAREGIDMTPVDAGPISQSRKDQDLALWMKWKETGSKSDMSAILNAMNGVIQKEVNRASGSIPKSVLEGSAKKWTIEAVKKYNPNSGAALATHVTSWLRKVRRMNYNHQNMVRIPEAKHLEYANFNNALGHLRETLNREPTDHEVAAHLEWKPTAVIKFKKMLFNDHYESGSEMAVEAHSFDFEQTKFNYILEQLDHQERMIMENLQAPDSKRLGNAALATKMGVNENRLSYLKTKLKTKVRSIQQSLGDWDKRG